jgi:hypothetical protein
MGQWGVVGVVAGVSAVLDLDVGFNGRAARTVSVEEVGVSSGMLVDDMVRCTGAGGRPMAVELARLAFLLGLASMLLLRERKPDRVAVVPVDAAAGRACGRAGDASREDSGDDGEPDTLRER